MTNYSTAVPKICNKCGKEVSELYYTTIDENIYCGECLLSVHSYDGLPPTYPASTGSFTVDIRGEAPINDLEDHLYNCESFLKGIIVDHRESLDVSNMFMLLQLLEGIQTAKRMARELG